MPIVMTQDSGRFEIVPYIAMRDGKNTHVEPAELVVVDDAATNDRAALVSPAPQIVTQSSADPCVTFGVEGPSLAEMFQRVTTAYDLARMSAGRMIVVGAGGAASFVEDMVRAGLGEVIIIDPDTVSEPNLATQHYRRVDIGRPKVVCLAERLRDINPQAVVIPHRRPLDDIADNEFAKLAFAPLRAWTVPAKDMSKSAWRMR
jgi:hypothetical protein